MAMLDSLVLDLPDVETVVLDSNVALEATEKILDAPPDICQWEPLTLHSLNASFVV